MQQLLKISSAGRIFGHLADRDADFLADPLAVAETGTGKCTRSFAGSTAQAPMQ
ncbi:hypothetical protein [Rhizobium sp. Kim5]|uniref:hypothetical protein n=1 Tax=Rhizobium sp. Kim5 TaxID=2020311 RepID=UPI0013DE1C44|nr:hypothetical protein [Rhizobium sp. Kim5]